MPSNVIADGPWIILYFCYNYIIIFIITIIIIIVVIFIIENIYLKFNMKI